MYVLVWGCVRLLENPRAFMYVCVSPEASAAAAALAAAVVADCPMLTEGMLVDGGGNADMLVSW